ncbi:MAG: ComF family protein [Dictyoglomaceae bacterium]|nr:ComF family protein [Dictyoglomaceae bacterium]HPU42620.1 ComF family protein [Dictyoglomaceae bacterium]
MSLIEKFFWELFFPTKCIFCGNYHAGYICPECFSKLPMPERYCKLCGRPLTGINEICYNCEREGTVWDGFEFLGYYRDTWEDVIKALKFQNKPYIAQTVAKLAKEKILKRNWKIDMVTFVPLSYKRIKERGYNQSEYLAYFLSKELKVSYGSLLYLKREIRPQKELSLEERVGNIKGAFEVDLPYWDKTYRNILIIDDVYTTGTTLKECVNTLKTKVRYDKMYAFTVVRAL